MKAGQADDPNFIQLLNSLVKGTLSGHTSQRVWVIQIDNWCDQKWLGFSGYGLIKTDIPIDRFDTAKAEFYQDKLTFPPFAPNRVLSQWSYVRTSLGYEESALPRLPHGTERRASSENLQRRVLDFDQSACFIWYSSNTHTNDRASVMVYIASSGGCKAWFASFSRKSEWSLEVVRGITRSDVAMLLETA